MHVLLLVSSTAYIFVVFVGVGIIIFCLQDYSAGDLLTGDLKKILIDILTPMVTAHQAQRKNITDQLVLDYMKPRSLSGLATKVKTQIPAK